MATKTKPDFVDEKNCFFNRQEMDFELICMFVSPKIQYHVISLSTPDEVWTKLEVLFEIKEYCEERMHDIDKTKPAKKPPEEQASQFEETFACTMHASQEPHAETSACATHASQVTLAKTFAHPMNASQEPHEETSHILLF